LLPAAVDSLGVRVFDRLDEALDGADVVMVLRIQQERLAGALLPSLREYARTFGIGPAAIAHAKPDAIVMHPGPMNRGIEIENIVADSERSVVLEQVEAGVAVRMALLYLFAGEASGAPAVGEVD
jgi:aspartate carbamoyltransferase catalytic subunit